MVPPASSARTTWAIRATKPNATGSSSNFCTLEPEGKDLWIFSFKAVRSMFASVGKILIDTSIFAKRFTTSIQSLRPWVPAFDATVGATEHSTFLTAPDSYFAAAWAWKFHCSFSGKYGSSAPRACWHPDDFLTCDCCCAQLLTLRVPTGTFLKVINWLLVRSHYTGLDMKMTDKFKQQQSQCTLRILNKADHIG